MDKKFSEREGLRGKPIPIKIRNDAPEEIRQSLIQIAKDSGMSPKYIRGIICAELSKRPDQNNWSDSNIWSEVEDLIRECDWFNVYDIAEKLHSDLEQRFHHHAQELHQKFTSSLNGAFEVNGVGYAMKDGKIISRGEEDYEKAVSNAIDILSEYPTSRSETEEALKGLSRRPKADLTGAITHGVTGLECFFREITGQDNATLGKIISDHCDRFPKPLDKALIEFWGFASQVGRHVKEGREPTYKEAELVVHVCAAMIAFLSEPAR